MVGRAALLRLLPAGADGPLDRHGGGRGPWRRDLRAEGLLLPRNLRANAVAPVELLEQELAPLAHVNLRKSRWRGWRDCRRTRATWHSTPQVVTNHNRRAARCAKTARARNRRAGIGPLGLALRLLGSSAPKESRTALSPESEQRPPRSASQEHSRGEYRLTSDVSALRFREPSRGTKYQSAGRLNFGGTMTWPRSCCWSWLCVRKTPVYAMARGAPEAPQNRSPTVGSATRACCGRRSRRRIVDQHRRRSRATTAASTSQPHTTHAIRCSQ